jgi:hypothetical protein
MVVLVVFFAILGSFIIFSYRDKKGFSLFGINHRGFKKNKLYKGKSKYDKKGFNFDGYNKEGFYENGFNKDGFNKYGINQAGFPWWYVNLYQLTEIKDQGKSIASYKFLNINSKNFIEPTQSKNKKLTKISNNIFKNPFFILGLNPSSGTKAIQRRVNDILKLISIGQTYRFDYDLLSGEIERTESIVKEAGIKLLNPLERINSLFFWFNFDDEGIKAFFKEENLESVIYYLSEKYITENNLLALKNAIIGSIFLSAKNQDIKPALLMMDYWPIIIANKPIWNQLLNQFNQNNDFDLNMNPVDQFKDKILQFIGDVYFQLYVSDPQDSMMFKFYKLFNQYPENYILKVI